MTLRQRLLKLEERKPVSNGHLSREALYKQLERQFERIPYDFDIANASPIELAAHLLFGDEVRSDAVVRAHRLSQINGPAAKLFRAILESRGVLQ